MSSDYMAVCTCTCTKLNELVRVSLNDDNRGMNRQRRVDGISSNKGAGGKRILKLLKDMMNGEVGGVLVLFMTISCGLVALGNVKGDRVLQVHNHHNKSPVKVYGRVP